MGKLLIGVIILFCFYLIFKGLREWWVEIKEETELEKERRRQELLKVKAEKLKTQIHNSSMEKALNDVGEEFEDFDGLEEVYEEKYMDNFMAPEEPILK